MCDEQYITEETVENADVKLCLNCGTELNGEFCHNCGQNANNSNSTIKGFVLEYLNNAFLWDTNQVRTIWQLMRRPGFLTKEFIAGKYVSYVHPLKLNMFILFVFITVFLLFSSDKKISHSVSDLTKEELFISTFQMDKLQENPAYVDKMNNSPRDTVTLYAPLFVVEEYPNILTCVDVIEDTNGQSLDKWTAVLPSVLIEDKILISDENGCYHFNKDSGIHNEDVELFISVWQQLVDLMTRYFPMIILLTTPFLSFSMRLMQIKHKSPRIHNFIFSLHYTAFLELFILFIYLVYLVAAPPVDVLQWVFTITSCTYLTIAFRRVYGIGSWAKSIAKALFLSFVYFLIILSLLIINFLVACIMVATQL